MASVASRAFETALVDVNNLMAFHTGAGGNAPGRRAANLGSLNKSAIVLLCAAWESYIESVFCECADRNIDAAVNPDGMLKSLRKLVSSHIRGHKNESVWQSAAGDGWRDLTKSVVLSKVSSLNTPKKGPINELATQVLGIREIERTWAWRRNPLGEPARRLDAFVQLRGSIAHGEHLAQNVLKGQVTSAKDLLTRLVKQVEFRLVQDGLLLP